MGFAPITDAREDCRAHKMAEGIPTKGFAMQHTRNENRFAVVHSRGGDSKKGVREAFAAGGPQRVGWFRFYFDDDRWEWSPQVEKMHGYLPGSVNPTTEIVLAHKHPDDYRHIAGTLDLIRQTRQPFSSRHRIIDAEGRIHHVVVVGDLLRNHDGSVIGTHGYYIDVTPSERERQDQMTAAVTRIAEARAGIDQAKGMLMLIYGMDDAAAFELLKWRSQETNVKLRLLAEQVVADFLALSGRETLPPRSTYDNLLLTAHLRINADIESGDATVLPASEDTG
jgi:PAS domain S-box-containing protein